MTLMEMVSLLSTLAVIYSRQGSRQFCCYIVLGQLRMRVRGSRFWQLRVDLGERVVS